MANRAKRANILNKRFIQEWQREREKKDEPWRIPNSPMEGWKDRLAKKFEKHKKGQRK